MNYEQEFLYYARFFEWVKVFEDLKKTSRQKTTSMENWLATVEGLAVGLLVKGEIYKFLTTVFGSSADRINEIIRNEVRCFNAQRTASAFAQSFKRLKDTGIEPKEVPLKLLLPLLDGISLENDNTLQEKWTNLLTSTLAGEASHPSYSDFLKRLSPLDANILNHLFDFHNSTECQEPNSEELNAANGLRILHDLKKKGINPSENELLWSLNYLMQIGLCQEVDLTIGRGFNLTFRVILTPTGWEFTKAVSYPTLKRMG